MLTTYIFLNFFVYLGFAVCLHVFQVVTSVQNFFQYLLKKLYVSRFVHFLPICSRITLRWTVKFHLQLSLPGHYYLCWETCIPSFQRLTSLEGTLWASSLPVPVRSSPPLPRKPLPWSRISQGLFLSLVASVMGDRVYEILAFICVLSYSIRLRITIHYFICCLIFPSVVILTF